MRTLMILGMAACVAGLAACGGRTRPMGEAESPVQIAQQIDRASSLVRDAQRLEQAGKDREAEAKYRLAIETYRELPAAWNNLGRLLMKSGTNLAAAEAFKTASELSPTDPVSMTNLGVLWESLGYLDDAARWYEEALKRNENHLPALRRMLVVEEARNKPDPVTLEHIRRALLVERDPWWSDRFQRARGRFEQMVNDTKTDAMLRPDLMGPQPKTPYPAPVPAQTPAAPPAPHSAAPPTGTPSTGVSPAWPE